ncbi:uncharacterized protein LOC108675295 [Hyalella azteca]|uniref:Uncharacterized protein LOC108675295 n=1 Tax=Hyalella azteca TaxID=294128 RepID=A0A8B7P131_HYAAZ|nr:uncharacterized protein LOC108675295 [Hyalella azteca]
MAETPLPPGPNVSLANEGSEPSDLHSIRQHPSASAGGGDANTSIAGGGDANTSIAGGGDANTSIVGGGDANTSIVGGGDANTSTVPGSCLVKKTSCPVPTIRCFCFQCNLNVDPSCEQGVAGKASKTPPSLLTGVQTDAEGVPLVVPKSLTYLLATCKPQSARQLLNLVLHITMTECGFLPTSCCAQTSATITKAVAALAAVCLPPQGWKEKSASLQYTHNSYVGLTFSLVLKYENDPEFYPWRKAYPEESLEISINVCGSDIPSKDLEIKTKLGVIDFVQKVATLYNNITLGKKSLCNVSKLAQKLRDDILAPLQLSIYKILGLPCPVNLENLPFDILMYITKKLDVRSVVHLSQTCKHLNHVCSDNFLWRHLFQRDLRPKLPEHIGFAEYSNWKTVFEDWKDWDPSKMLDIEQELWEAHEYADYREMLKEEMAIYEQISSLESMTQENYDDDELYVVYDDVIEENLDYDEDLVLADDGSYDAELHYAMDLY